MQVGSKKVRSCLAGLHASEHALRRWSNEPSNASMRSCTPSADTTAASSQRANHGCCRSSAPSVRNTPTCQLLLPLGKRVHMHQRQRLPLPQPRAEGAVERVQELNRRCRQVHDNVLEQAAATAAAIAVCCCRRCRRRLRSASVRFLLLLLRWRLRLLLRLGLRRLLCICLLLLLLLGLAAFGRLGGGRWHNCCRSRQVQAACSCLPHEGAAVHVEGQHLAAHPVQLDVGAQVLKAGGVQVVGIHLGREELAERWRGTQLTVKAGAGVLWHVTHQPSVTAVAS